MALAPNVAVLIVGRLILGLGFGKALMIAPIYLSETAPEHMRGSMTSMTILLASAGQLIAYAAAIALGD